MPRFRTLSDAINSAIDARVPVINFPDGSIINQQICRIPHLQSANDSVINKRFTWGFSTWGIESITSQYKPE